MTITKDKRLSLTFNGHVRSGLGRFSRLVFPDRFRIPGGAPEDWPDPARMAKGSLNFQITMYPEELESLTGKGHQVTGLDSRRFSPEFSIPADMIENNSIQPHPANPDRGIAQVWRTEVTNEDTGETFKAWAVRRIGSVESQILELMADRKLREAHKLQDGTPLTLKLFSKAQP